MYAIKENKVVRPFDSHECVPDLSLIIYPCTPSRHRFLHISCSCRISYSHTLLFHISRRDHARLDTTIDLPRRAAHLARLDIALGPRQRYAQARGHPRRASRVLYVIFNLPFRHFIDSQGRRTFNITPKTPPAYPFSSHVPRQT